MSFGFNNMNAVKRTGVLTLVVGLLLCSQVARAALEIEITQGVEAGIPVAVVPFEWKGSGVPPHFVSDIIEADLKRSGRFDTIPRGDFLSNPHDHTQVNYKDCATSSIDVFYEKRPAPGQAVY